MMEGFGVHTFRMINAEGVASFVKFHWKPRQGVHSVLWDEAQKLAGKDTDYHRRDLWEAIETGDYPEWELGVQIVPEADEHTFDFDLLDPTKIIPEELVPVTLLGKMVLNRNPDNSSPKPSRSPSARGTSCRASTSATTRCCRDGCSPTPTPRSAGWVGRTSMKSRSTGRWHRTTAASAMPCTA